jgi:hypothetical protein
MIIYVIHALKWGNPENHSVIVAVVEQEQSAFDIAMTYETDRCGKYGCKVLKMDTEVLFKEEVVRLPYEKKGEYKENYDSTLAI